MGAFYGGKKFWVGRKTALRGNAIRRSKGRIHVAPQRFGYECRSFGSDSPGRSRVPVAPHVPRAPPLDRGNTGRLGSYHPRSECWPMVTQLRRLPIPSVVRRRGVYLPSNGPARMAASIFSWAGRHRRHRRDHPPAPAGRSAHAISGLECWRSGQRFALDESCGAVPASLKAVEAMKQPNKTGCTEPHDCV